jgi:hypothetical protein
MLFDDLAAFSRRPVSRWIKWPLWLVVWGAVVVATFSDTPDYFLAALSFPVGFYGLLPPETGVLLAWVGVWPTIVVGWMGYFWLMFAMKRAKYIPIFSLWYVLLCVFVVINVAGCRKLMTTIAGIH